MAGPAARAWTVLVLVGTPFALRSSSARERTSSARATAASSSASRVWSNGTSMTCRSEVSTPSRPPSSSAATFRAGKSTWSSPSTGTRIRACSKVLGRLSARRKKSMPRYPTAPVREARPSRTPMRSAAVAEPLHEARRKLGITHQPLRPVDLVPRAVEGDAASGHAVADLEHRVGGVRQSVTWLSDAAGIEKRPLGTELDHVARQAGYRLHRPVDLPVHDRQVGVA